MHKYKSFKNTTVYFLKIFLAMNKPPEKREVEATKHNPEWMIQTYDGCDAQTPLGVLYRLVLVTQYSPLLAAQ